MQLSIFASFRFCAKRARDSESLVNKMEMKITPEPDSGLVYAIPDIPPLWYLSGS